MVTMRTIQSVFISIVVDVDVSFRDEYRSLRRLWPHGIKNWEYSLDGKLPRAPNDTLGVW